MRLLLGSNLPALPARMRLFGAFLISTIDSKPEPEAVKEKEHHESGDRSRRSGLRDFANDEKEVATNAQGERDHSGNQDATREAVKVLCLFAALDDAVIRGGRHQQDDAHGNKREAHQMYVL